MVMDFFISGHPLCMSSIIGKGPSRIEEIAAVLALSWKELKQCNV